MSSLLAYPGFGLNTQKGYQTFQLMPARHSAFAFDSVRALFMWLELYQVGSWTIINLFMPQL